ncbi:MAG TPA: cation transporter [Candidatus Dormibacteraeota bacterium]
MDLTRAAAVRRGLRLEVVTVAWMLVEASVALGAGVAARSALLTAFGLDSVVELLSGIVLYRRLQVESSGAPAEDVDRLEARTTAISAVLLIVLCVFVVLSSIVGIVLRIEPEGSLVGIAVSAVAVVAMPLLAWQKRRVNAVVGSPSLRADIAETISCAYLAAVTLAGLAATTLFGWWWAQYVAAIALLIWLVPEAREAFWAWRDNEPDQLGGRD